MRRIIIGLALLAAAVFASSDASAETCTVSSGYTKWTAVTTNTGTDWSGCTDSADDTFTIAGGEVEVTADILITTGNVTCSSGTLRINPGAGITFTDASGTEGRAGVTVRGTCTLYMDGAVVWNGRIGATAISNAVGPPQTTTFTLAGTSDISTDNSATTDYLVFGDDDPESATATITQPVQIGSGPPAPGYYRPTYPKWTWWDVNALSGATVTINTDPYTNPQTLPGGGTDPFPGVRGPGVTTSVAIASMARTQHGFMTALSLDLEATEPMATKGTVTSTGGAHEGTLGAQYVTVTTGACANRTYKIAYVDAVTSTTTEPDIIYVMGDLTEECGATPEIVINYGWRNGDPVKLVRPAYINGANQVRIDWIGGSVKANWARFVNLFPMAPATMGFGYACLICINRTDATTQPTFAGSFITNSNIAFPNVLTTGGDTGAITFNNLEDTVTTYKYGTSQLDATGLVLDRIYVNDQRLESTSGAGGVHGLFVSAATGVSVTRFRTARLGDDTMVFIGDVDGNTSQTQTLTARQVWADEGMGLSNSQQLFDATYPSTDGGLDTDGYSVTISDYGGACCADGGFSAKTFNTTMDRVVSLGTNGTPGGIAIGGALSSSFTATPLDSGATNSIRDSVVMMAGPTADTNHLVLDANVSNSIFAGNLQSNSQAVQSPRSIAETFIQLGVANIDFFKRYSASTSGIVANAASTVRTRDSVILNARTNAGSAKVLHDPGSGVVSTCVGSGNPLPCCSGVGAGTCSSMDGNSVYTDYEITRTVFGANSVPAGGLCDATCQNATGIAGGRTLTVDGLTVASREVTAGGVGMGDTGEGTLGGANISNGCIESSASPLDVNVYGASRTATSVTLDDNGPNPDDDVPISTWVANTATSSICANTSKPRKLGLSKFGTVHGMLGDGFAGHIDLFTTDKNLIRSVTGGGGRSGPPSIGGR